MDVIRLLGSAMGLGFVSGLNLYATVLVVGLGIRFGLVTLNPELASLDVLASPAVLIAAALLYLVEFFADKIPWLDSLWDGVHTLIRPLGAAALGATAIGTVDAQMVVGALLCGGVALTGHSTKAGTRLLANHSPEPFSNIALSLAEDVLVVGGTWMALAHPLVMLTLVLIFLGVFLWFAPKVFRLMRVEFLAAFSAVRALCARAKRFAFGLAKRPAPAGAEFGGSFLLDENAYGGAPAPRLSEDPPERYTRYLSRKVPMRDTRACVRCVAGKGVKGLRHSVGYLHLTDDGLVFVARRMFRFRHFRLDRHSVEDVRFNRRLLLDRLVFVAEGKRRQFFFFKDVAERGEIVSGMLGGPGGRR